MTIVCPGPIETSNASGAASSENKASREVSSYYPYHDLVMSI